MPRSRCGRRWSIACLVGGLILIAGSASPEPVVESARLNARLAKTPLAGLGEYLLSEGARVEKQRTLDPRLVVAIAGAESSFGTRICTPFNAWNWFWEGPCRPRRPDGSTPSPFSDWQRGIAVVSKFLKKSYLLKGYTTIPLIGSKYCAEGCQHWEPNVTKFYTDLGGDVNDLTYPHSVPPPAGTEKPIDTGPVPTPGGTEKPVDTSPVPTPGGTEKPVDPSPVPPTEKPIDTGPVPPPASSGTTPGASSDAKASASGSAATGGPPVSSPVDETGLPIWLWTVLAITLAAVSGAAGFALGRRTRH